MRAVVLRETGSADGLRVEEVPEPVVGPEDVLVRVGAVAVCGRDLIDRRGGFPMMKLPTILGHELAGDVVALGSDAARASDLRPGDRVLALHRPFCGACRPCLDGEPLFCERAWQSFGHTIDGGYAELVAAPHRALVKIPAEIPVENASLLMCTAAVSLRALRAVGRLALGDTLLVTGATGGVGVMAVQIGVRMGARVVAITSSPEKEARLRELGAHEVVVSPKADFQDAVKRLGGADVALELTGSATFVPALKSLRRGGRMVVLGNIETTKVSLNPGALILHAQTIAGSYGCTNKDVRDVVDMVVRGDLRPVVNRVLPLADAAEAHRLLERRAAFGRIVLRP